jgi:O-acetyl-ADP-ribose deacetylase (regulator of RNase III)
MNLYFVDQDPDVVSALAKAFETFPEVCVSCGDILSMAEVCVVSPANGYGYMDGGVDAAYRRYFGEKIETKVRDAIAARPEGHLPVGASLVVATGDKKIPFIIVAPTMLMPEMVSALHSARAMRAVLRALVSHESLLTSVYCPGLATGVGSVPSEEAASAMVAVYRSWRNERSSITSSVSV